MSSDPPPGRSAGPPADRLDSWKEIAVYLGRDERTVRRWEKSEQLPVHRHVHQKGSSVYAFKSELDQWRAARRLESDAVPAADEAPAEAPSGWNLVTPAVLSVLLLAAVGGVLAYFSRSAESPSGSARLMLAVLPFENMGATDQQYFSDGLTEELITEIAGLNRDRLGVVARTTVLQYRDAPARVRAIGRELNASHIIEGSVRFTEGRARITVQLIAVDDESHLWAQAFERDLNDVFGIQREIAREVAHALAVELLPESSIEARRPARSPEAYQAYLRGRYEWNTRTAEGLRRAIDAFQAAIAADPGYAEAYGGLAGVYALLGFYSVAPPSQVLPRAQAAAKTALELDETIGEAWASLGWATFLLDGNWNAAEQSFQRAIALDPDSATVYHWRGLALAAMERFDESLAALEHGQKLEPMGAIISANRALVLAAAGRVDDAISQCLTVLELDSNFHYAQWMLGLNYDLQGKSVEAANALRIAIERSNGNPSYRASLGYVLARAGQRAEAEEILAGLERDARRTYIPPFYPALVHAGLDNRDQAFAGLSRAVNERSGSIRFLKIDTRFERLRDDPRFHDLLVRLKLAE